MTDTKIINRDYLERLVGLGLPIKPPSDEWVVLDMHGDDKIVSSSFNFRVYRNKWGILTLVTNDYDTLQRLLKGRTIINEEGKRVISIDDSGWGFPIGGVLCGAYDSETGRFYKREAEVGNFQGKKFEKKLYLDRYMDRVLEIVDEINPNLEETIIRICTGYVNIKAKKALRQRNSLVVEIDRIGEPLQTWLEAQHRMYIKELVGADIYYDPKGMPKREVARRFDEVVDFAETHDLMHLVKTGWKYFQGRR